MRSTPLIAESLPHKDGLVLHDSISMSVRTKRLFPRMLLRIVLAMLGVSCSAYCVQGFYLFPFDMEFISAFTVLVTAVCGMMFCLPRKLRWSVIFLLLGFEVMVYRYWEECLAGYRTILRVIIAQVEHKPRMSDLSTFTERWNEQQCATFFACVILFLVIFGVTYFLVLKPNFLFCFVLTFPFLECGLLFGYETDSRAVFGMVSFWLAVLALQFSGSKLRIKRKIAKLDRNRMLSVDRVDSRLYAGEATALVLLLLTFAVGGLMMNQTKSYVRSERIDRQRGILQTKFSNASFNDIMGILNKIPLPVEPNMLMDEVELSGQGNVSFDGGVVMNVSLPMNLPLDDVYLKGIARGQYTGSGWTTMARAYRANKDVFSALVDLRQFPQTLDFSGIYQGKEQLPLMHIKTVKTELVNYLPYQTRIIANELKSYLFDTELRMKSQSDYTISLDTSLPPDFSRMPIGLRDTRSSNKAMRDYEDFVYENYASTAIDDSLEESVFKPFREYFQASGAHSDYASELEVVKQYIWERADYTLSPGDTPRGKDLVAYFLNENHAGYCAHYASAAVLLCRSIGIPARYCQGYVMSKADYLIAKQAAEHKGEAVIPIYDHRAHAWAEIFVPGIGWIPYEFTEDVQSQWNSAIHYIDESTTELVTTEMTTEMTTAVTTAVTTVATSYTTVVTTVSVDNSDGGEGDSSTDTPKEPFLSAKAKVAILVCILIAGAVMLAVWVMRKYHANIVVQRKQKMLNGEPNAAAGTAYGFLLKLLSLEGIVQGNLRHEQFAAYAQERSKYLPKDSMADVVAIVQEAVFSGRQIAAEDVQKLYETVEATAKHMYESADKKAQFRLKWIHHIVA